MRCVDILGNLHELNSKDNVNFTINYNSIISKTQLNITFALLKSTIYTHQNFSNIIMLTIYTRNTNNSFILRRFGQMEGMGIIYNKSTSGV